MSDNQQKQACSETQNPATADSECHNRPSAFTNELDEELLDTISGGTGDRPKPLG